MGGAFGQTARLAVVADSEPVPDPSRVPRLAPCEVEVAFQSASGVPLASKVMKLVPGEAGFLDLTLSSFVRFGERVVISPFVMSIAPGSAAGCRIASLGQAGPLVQAHTTGHRYDTMQFYNNCPGLT